LGFCNQGAPKRTFRIQIIYFQTVIVKKFSKIVLIL